jgi:short-subunit dehydrogenase
MNVIITGASQGIGKAVAEKYAAGGYNLFLCSKNEERLLNAAEDIAKRNMKISISTYPADLSDIKQVKAFANWVLQKNITIDIIVNNAGNFFPGSIHEEEEGVLEKMIAVNLYGAYHLTRALLTEMIKKKSGHIFNISSIAALKAYPNGGSYSISKYALTGFSKNLREEMKPYNIKVTTVYPGAVYTSSWEASGVDPNRIMEARDIADSIYSISKLSPQACVEDIVLRPQLGDL